MLIHSVTPAHALLPDSPIPASTYRQCGTSWLEGVETPQGFQLRRLHSTDPMLYLRREWTPDRLLP